MRTSYLLAALVLTGCGPVGPLDESAVGDVFLYTINGYPGADTMTLKLGGKRIAAGVPFGSRFGDDGDCPEGQVCLPTVVRRTGKPFDLRFSGASSSQWDASADLAGMYPQETGTAIVTGPARGVIVRHPQSISSSCALSVVNALAVDDLSSDDGAYDIAIETKLSPAAAGFGDEAATPFIGPCGGLPLDELHDELLDARVGVLDAVTSSPWFFPVACEDDSGDTCFAWPVQSEDHRGKLEAGGSIHAPRDSASFYTCVEAAFSAPSCGAEPSWSDIVIDHLALAACHEPVRRQATMIAPQSTGRFEGLPFCEVSFRVRTAERDLVFGPNDGDQSGTHGDGDLVEGTTRGAATDSDVPGVSEDIGAGAEMFWVLYGRPVNPRVWRWLSTETFVDLDAYPYPD